MAFFLIWLVGAGALHGAASYATAKVLNKEHSVFAHAVGGAAAGCLVRYKGDYLHYC